MKRGIIQANRSEERRAARQALPPQVKVVLFLGCLVVVAIAAVLGSSNRSGRDGVTTTTTISPEVTYELTKLGNDLRDGFSEATWFASLAYTLDGDRVVATLVSASSDPKMLCSVVNNYVTAELTHRGMRGTVLRDATGAQVAETYSTPGPCY